MESLQKIKLMKKLKKLKIFVIVLQYFDLYLEDNKILRFSEKGAMTDHILFCFFV